MYRNIGQFKPNTVLYSDGNVKLTVAVALDMVDYVIGFLATKNEQIEKYKKAKIFFNAVKLMLNNKTPKRPGKEYYKFAVDAVEEIKNMQAQSEQEKILNAQYSLFLKLIIDFGIKG